MNRAETELNTLFIKREVFLELAEKYPGDIEKLTALAYFRYKHFLFVNFSHNSLFSLPNSKSIRMKKK